MAVNLTELVQHLSHISNGKDPHLHERCVGYGDAIAYYWAGENERALDLVTRLLADDPDGEHRFASYRLWIELLAASGDQGSLRALTQHLAKRGLADPDHQETWMALRGIAHFELDEFEAASLMSRAVEGYAHNGYCLELNQCVAFRKDAGADRAPELCGATSRLDDFFHWQTLARGLLTSGNRRALSEVLTFVSSHFRGAPLPHFFEYHLLVQDRYYAGAALVAERLIEMYPENADYHYYRAYALFEEGDYPRARSVLVNALHLVEDDDAEFFGLLGHTHARMGEAEAAARYLKQAISILKGQGLPTSHMNLELANVEDELRGDAVDPAMELPRATRFWLVPLSERRYLEFLNSTDQSVEHLIRPMGAHPRAGDYCFFTRTERSARNSNSAWQIVAIYVVDSDPVWHPIHHYDSALRLVQRLPEGIPVDVKVLDQDQSAGAGKVARDPRHHASYGIYELDHGALDVIEEAVRLHRNEIIERRQDGGKSRRPTG